MADRSLLNPAELQIPLPAQRESPDRDRVGVVPPCQRRIEQRRVDRNPIRNGSRLSTCRTWLWVATPAHCRCCPAGHRDATREGEQAVSHLTVAFSQS